MRASLLQALRWPRARERVTSRFVEKFWPQRFLSALTCDLPALYLAGGQVGTTSDIRHDPPAVLRLLVGGRMDNHICELKDRAALAGTPLLRTGENAASSCWVAAGRRER